MSYSRELIDRRTYARPIRLVAFFVALMSAGWELAARGVDLGSEPGTAIFVIRSVESVVALAVAFLASPARPLWVLFTLIWVLALSVAAANIALMAVLPSALWEAMLVIGMTVLASALFAPWSWRWQAALASAIVLFTLLAMKLAVPPHLVPFWMGPRIVITLIAAGLVSVVGAWVKERERARLLDSEVRFRGLFDAAGDAIAVFDERGALLDGNLRFEALMGSGMGRLRAGTLCEWLEPDPDGAGRRVDCEELLRSVGARPRTVTGTLVRPAGPAIDVEVTLVRMPGPEGPIVQAIVRDLTERRSLERRHVQTQRVEALSRLAGGLAHQFNNLLGGILNQAMLLRRDARDGQVQAQLDAIAHAARRGERLTKELLRFTPHAAISIAATPVAQVMSSIDALVRSEAHGQVEVDVAPGVSPIAADLDHLVPALMELIFNAWDATAGRPHPGVRLAVSEERVVEGDVRWSGASAGRYVGFAVIDRGAGMDAATRERLFEPFFTTKPMHEAEGLGLATVYWVVRAHGGAIAIDSAPGKGTTVRLLIPVAEPAEPRRAAPRSPEDLTVLVVDDDPLIRQTAARALTHFGYRVLSAEDGASALGVLGTSPDGVHLAILDVVMPGGGAPLMERIREAHPDVRVLLSSGYGPAGEVRQMIDMGARGFLQKPYEIRELKAAVEAALG